MAHWCQRGQTATCGQKGGERKGGEGRGGEGRGGGASAGGVGCVSGGRSTSRAPHCTGVLSEERNHTVLVIR